MKIVAVIAVIQGAFLVGTSSAEARHAPPGLASVICKAHQSAPQEGKTTVPGVYSYRPHNCLTHKYHLSQPAFQLYAKIKWDYWDPEEAYGQGGIPGEIIGAQSGARSIFYDPTTIRLVAPLLVCGRLIFTAAVFDYVEEDFVYHEQLD